MLSLLSLGGCRRRPLADQYRNYAAECVRVAQQNQNDKLVLLQMAETWRRLAERIEARVPLLPNRAKNNFIAG